MSAFTRKWKALFGSDPMAARTTPTARLGMEALEAREVPAALTAALSAGILRIEGTELADKIYVARNAGQIAVESIKIATPAGARATVPASSVQKIEVYARGGDDIVRFNRGTEPNAIETYVAAGSGNDLVVGGAGADYLSGESGNDTLYGEAGNDTLSGGEGVDWFDGGAGTDKLVESADGDFTLTNYYLYTSFGREDHTGIEAADLTGGNGNNILDAHKFVRGPVTLDGGAGNDTLYGGAGDDVLSGGAGVDWFDGGAGTDKLVESADGDFTLTNYYLYTSFGREDHTGIEAADLTGGNGNNILDAHKFVRGPVTLDGGAGNDTLYGGAGNDKLYGGEGNDVLDGGAGADRVRGNGGNDRLTGGLNYDQIEGDDGFDTLVETADSTMYAGNLTLTDTTLYGLGGDSIRNIEAAELTGDNANNILDASAFSGPVTLNGANGNDTLLGGYGNDTLLGGYGNDTLSGGAGVDRFDGGAGTDKLVESANGDFTLTNYYLYTDYGREDHAGIEAADLTGGHGNNTLDARKFGRGPVTLNGGAGNDTLYGGAGSDTLDGGDGLDVIAGFGSGDRVIANGKTLSGAIAERWIASGGESGSLGLPTGEVNQGSGFTWQDFQKGVVYYSGATGAHAILGNPVDPTTFWGQFKAAGFQNGLGLPTSEVQQGSGFTWQQFQKGAVYQPTGGAAQAIIGNPRDLIAAAEAQAAATARTQKFDELREEKRQQVEAKIRYAIGGLPGKIKSVSATDLEVDGSGTGYSGSATITIGHSWGKYFGKEVKASDSFTVKFHSNSDGSLHVDAIEKQFNLSVSVAGKPFSLASFTVSIPVGQLRDVLNDLRGSINRAGASAAATAREQNPILAQIAQQWDKVNAAAKQELANPAAAAAEAAKALETAKALEAAKAKVEAEAAKAAAAVAQAAEVAAKAAAAQAAAAQAAAAQAAAVVAQAAAVAAAAVKEQAAAAATAAAVAVEEAVATVKQDVGNAVEAAKKAGDDIAKGAKQIGGQIAEAFKNLSNAIVPDEIESIIDQFVRTTVGLLRAPLLVVDGFVGSLQTLGNADLGRLGGPAGSGIALAKANPFASLNASTILDAASKVGVDALLKMAGANISVKDEGGGRWSVAVALFPYSFSFTWRTTSATDLRPKELTATAGYSLGPVVVFATAAMGAGLKEIGLKFEIPDVMKLIVSVDPAKPLDAVQTTMSIGNEGSGLSIQAKGVFNLKMATYTPQTVTLSGVANLVSIGGKAQAKASLTGHYNKSAGDAWDSDAWYFTVGMSAGTEDVKLGVQADPQTGKVTGTSVSVTGPQTDIGGVAVGGATTVNLDADGKVTSIGVTVGTDAGRVGVQVDPRTGEVIGSTVQVNTPQTDIGGVRVGGATTVNLDADGKVTRIGVTVTAGVPATPPPPAPPAPATDGRVINQDPVAANVNPVGPPQVQPTPGLDPLTQQRPDYVPPGQGNGWSAVSAEPTPTNSTKVTPPLPTGGQSSPKFTPDSSKPTVSIGSQEEFNKQTENAQVLSKTADAMGWVTAVMGTTFELLAHLASGVLVSDSVFKSGLKRLADGTGTLGLSADGIKIIFAKDAQGRLTAACQVAVGTAAERFFMVAGTASLNPVIGGGAVILAPLLGELSEEAAEGMCKSLATWALEQFKNPTPDTGGTGYAPNDGGSGAGGGI